jgi:hypothetical protein
VTGGSPGQKIVLYTTNGKCWVQPLVDQPITNLRPDFRWTNAKALGTHYAALLVQDSYRPQTVLESLPQTDDSILAVAVVSGADPPPSPIMDFSGLPVAFARRTELTWRPERLLPVHCLGRPTRGTAPAHHLGPKGTGVARSPNLGYGTYALVVRGIDTPEPATAFGMHLRLCGWSAA